MSTSSQIQFGPFRFDASNSCLWRDAERISLSPKDCAILQYLLGHAGQVVTKEDLFEAVWPETAVSDAALKTSVKRLRQVLGDDPKAPQFIETVHRRGYRFLSPRIGEAEPGKGSVPASPVAEQQMTPWTPPPVLPLPQPPLIVGREQELRQLQHYLEQACQGKRQMIFISGEPGIGKTTLVDAFVAQIATTRALRITAGQCVEQYGTGERYRPVLEALSRLCRTPRDTHLPRLLQQYAPTWLEQIPWLLSKREAETEPHTLIGAPQERMLREFAEVLEVLTAETPLVLILEDLHWSDYATLDVLTVLARRREPACLLVLGTYRPLTMLEKDHPLQTISQELLLHGYCTELPLSFLSAGAVATYLMVRLPGQKLPVGLVSWLHQYTGGNPLFLVTMVEHLLEQGWLEEVGEQWKVPAGLAEGTRSMPKTLRQLIETQLAQLGPEERQLLKVGSVVGEEFSSAAVAAGIATDVRQVEAWAEGLVRREHFLRAQGIDTWADGTVTARYRFLHTLYQQVIYDLIPPVHRQQLHQQIGLRLEQGYGEWVVEIAAELARHFAEAQDYQRTVHYRRLSQLVRWVTRTVRP